MTWGNAPPPRQRARSGAVTDERCLFGMTATTELGVQCCGEAQLLTLGMPAAPDGQPVFDVDDLDELLPALFEWDVEPQEAQEPAPAPYTGPGEYEHQGERPATEQHAAQAATDGIPGRTDGERLTGAVANGRLNPVLGPPPANPEPPLSGPLLRQGSGGRGRAGAAPAQPVSG
jgi:hypothetical protein